ncbi:hypothetical protein F5146DRAFT_1004035 [Armillaria mellea]|nr:hypothetical protein F5146DRAFT_1004035 [Armillaria mellea]
MYFCNSYWCLLGMQKLNGGNSRPSFAAGLGALGAFIATILTAILIIKIKLRKLNHQYAEEDAAAHTVALAMDTVQEPPSLTVLVLVLVAEEQGPPPSMTTAPEEDSKYPFPVGPDKDGNFGVEIINLSSSSNSSIDFMELCKQYNLAHSGTKPVRQQRLIMFSNAYFPSPPSLLLPAWIAHKGIRNLRVTSGRVTKAKNPRKPTHLHARLLNANASWPVNTSVVGLSVQRLKDTRSQAEIDEILLWCRHVQARVANAKP